MTYERSYNLINSKFKEMFIPTLLVSIAGNFAVLADAFIISFLINPLSLSVIQSIGPYTSFINVIYWLFGFGGSILSTAARAEFKEKESNQIFTVSIIGILIISITLTVLGFIFHDQFIQVLCNSNELRPLVGQYFGFFNIGVPFLSYMAVLAYFIKTDDFIQLQFRSFLLANVLNVILDVVFIKYLNMGIGGPGLATATSFIMGALYITTYFLREKGTLKIVKIKIKESLQQIIDISKAGLATASIPLYQALKLLIINGIILGLMGEVGLAAYNMCNNCLFIVTIFVLGAAQSLLPIIAVYYNEGDYNGVDYVAKRSLKIVIGFGIFFTALFAIFPQIVVSIFSVSDPSQIPIVINAIRIFSLSILGYSISYLYMFYTQSVQYTQLANIVTALEGLILPVVFAYALSTIWGINGVWSGFIFAEFGTVLFIYVYSKYMTKKTNGEYSGFFLNKRVEKERTFEYTVEGNLEDAVYLSRDVQEFIIDPRLSVFVSLAIEEMVVYIIELNKEKLDWIDVIIRDSDKHMIISLKHSGLGYNPKNTQNESENIKMLTNISEKIDYSQILGLNNTVITIKK